MSRRRTYDESKTRNIIQTYTVTSSANMPPNLVNTFIGRGATHMGLFIVAGGGGGGGDTQTSGGGGGGGTGGEIKIIEDIELSSTSITAINCTIGSGGAGGAHANNGTNGSTSSVTYSGTTYTARGGWGGYTPSSTSVMEQRPRLDNSGYGGAGGGWKESTNIQKYYTRTYEDSLSSTPLTWSVKGEEGITNPFDSTDNTVYSSGGGAGYNSYGGYDCSSTYPNYGGTGAGRGGYGANNASTNKGASATSYGCGGGGGAFSSGHGYSQGGSGYQGVIKIYFYKYA